MRIELDLPRETMNEISGREILEFIDAWARAKEHGATQMITNHIDLVDKALRNQEKDSLKIRREIQSYRTSGALEVAFELWRAHPEIVKRVLFRNMEPICPIQIGWVSGQIRGLQIYCTGLNDFSDAQPLVDDLENRGAVYQSTEDFPEIRRRRVQFRLLEAYISLMLFLADDAACQIVKQPSSELKFVCPGEMPILAHRSGLK